jgi:hypothetical protein
MLVYLYSTIGVKICVLTFSVSLHQKPKRDNEQSFRVSGITFITFQWISFYLKGHTRAVQKQGRASLLRVKETAV